MAKKSKSKADMLAEAKSLRAIPSVDAKHPQCVVKELRNTKGLTLSEVGDGCEMSQSGVLRVERGGELHLSHAFNLAEFFGMSVEEIWRPERK